MKHKIGEKKTPMFSEIIFTRIILSSDISLSQESNFINSEIKEVKLLTAFQEIIKFLPQLPFEVLKDIERRIAHWIWSGGNEDEPYILQ